MTTYSVAIVAACPFPANHGTPAAIREMCEGLVAVGHSVHVVTYPLKDEIPIEDGITIHRVRHAGRSRQIVVGPSYQRIAFDALMVPKLCRVIRKERIEIIHAFNYEGALIGYGAKKMTGLPLIYNAINTMINELPSYNFIRPKSLAVKLANMLDTHVPRMADFIIADTEELRSFLLAKGIPPDRVEVIPSGVNVEMFECGDGQVIRKKLSLGDRPLVIYTGTFDRFQGIDYLLKAFQVVQDKVPEAALLLLGSTMNPVHVEEYRRMADETGIGGSLIMLPSDLKSLPDYLAASDVAVVPRPSSPGIPTKLLNYMAAAKAIVSFEGSAKGIVHGVSGLLVKGNDWEKMAEEILVLLHDKAFAARLGSTAKECISGTLDWKTIVQRIEMRYSRLVCGNGCSPRRCEGET